VKVISWMKKTSIEIIVGIFIIVGLICVGYLTIRLGKKELIGSNYYKIYAKFASVSGLKKGARIEIAGVQIGQVNSITLDNASKAALVEMKINKDIIFTDDAIASIRTSGLIGDKYVKISYGSSDLKLKPGDVIIDTESALDIEELISKYAFGKF